MIQQPLENTPEIKAFESFKPGKPRPVKQATFHAETFWPGKGGSDTAYNPTKHPKIKMLWVPGDGLLCEWIDGSRYTVPANNVKGFEEF